MIKLRNYPELKKFNVMRLRSVSAAHVVIGKELDKTINSQKQFSTSTAQNKTVRNERKSV